VILSVEKRKKLCPDRSCFEAYRAFAHILALFGSRCTPLRAGENLPRLCFCFSPFQPRPSFLNQALFYRARHSNPLTSLGRQHRRALSPSVFLGTPYLQYFPMVTPLCHYLYPELYPLLSTLFVHPSSRWKLISSSFPSLPYLFAPSALPLLRLRIEGVPIHGAIRTLQPLSSIL